MMLFTAVEIFDNRVHIGNRGYKGKFNKLRKRKKNNTFMRNVNSFFSNKLSMISKFTLYGEHYLTIKHTSIKKNIVEI